MGYIYIPEVPGHYLELEPERPGGNDGGTTIRLWEGEEDPTKRRELTRHDMFRGQAHSHSNPIGGNGGGPRHNLEQPREGESRREWILRVFPGDLDDRLRMGKHGILANAITNNVLAGPLKEIEARLEAAGV